jgi:hypothetical protein
VGAVVEALKELDLAVVEAVAKVLKVHVAS